MLRNNLKLVTDQADLRETETRLSLQVFFSSNAIRLENSSARLILSLRIFDNFPRETFDRICHCISARKHYRYSDEMSLKEKIDQAERL